MKSKNVVQLHEVNTHTKESIKTTRLQFANNPIDTQLPFFPDYENFHLLDTFVTSAPLAPGF